MADGAAFAYAWIQCSYACGKITQAELRQQMRWWRKFWIESKQGLDN